MTATPATIAETLTQGERALPFGHRTDIRPGFTRCSVAGPPPDLDGVTIELQGSNGVVVNGWPTRRFLRTLAPGTVTYWVLPDGADRAICVEPLAWRVRSQADEEPRP